MTARTEIVNLLTENRDLVGSNLNDIWRTFAEDMIAAGIDPKEVVETMISVAITQGMKVYGPGRMAEVLHNQAAVFEVCAEEGVEFADLKPTRFDS